MKLITLFLSMVLGGCTVVSPQPYTSYNYPTYSNYPVYTYPVYTYPATGYYRFHKR
jgi:hypothetical protein